MAAAPFPAAILRDAAPRGAAPQDEVPWCFAEKKSIAFPFPRRCQVAKIDFRLTIVLSLANVDG
jgi:hypothetical protein